MVSYETAVYRLKNLGHVAQAASTRLLEQKDIGRQFLHLLYSFEGFDVAPNASETGRRQRELVPQVASLAVEAFRRGEISRGRLRDLGRTLNVSGDKLADLAEASVA